MISAINATQIEVKLSKATNKAELFANGVSGTLKTGVTLTVTPIGSTTAETLVATLSEDGKTITLTKATAIAANRYVVKVEALKAKDGSVIKKYDEIVTIAEDKTAPVITGTKTISATVAEVTFSEPLSAFGTISYKYADGTAVTAGDVTAAFNADKTSVIFTMQATSTVGKAIVATIIGAQDTNNNLLNPNPATVTFTKGAKDGIKPIVASVTQTGIKKLEVKFSEELQATPTFTIAGSAGTAVRDANDKTKYIVTTTAALDGPTTVAITGFTDLSGEVGDAYSKAYTFVAADITSSVVSTEVYKDAANGKEYLQITFDNNVEFATPTVNVTGSFVKDNITTTLAGTTAVTPTYKDPLNKKVILVDLAALLTGTSMDIEGAVYNTTLIFANVKSESGKAVVNTFKSVFTRGKNSTVVTTVPTVSTAVQSATDNNIITVTFDMNVDLATATNASNYSVDGAVVSSATATSGSTSTINLTLQEGSNTFTGTRNVTVKNVKALNGTKAMTTKTIVSGVIKENVAPTFTASLFDLTTIKVEFSEAIAHSTLTTALGASNFTVMQNGAANTVTAVSSDTLGSPTAAAASTGYKTVYLTISAITDLTKPITLSATNIQDVTKVGGSLTSAEEIGNKVSTAVVTITQ